MTTAAAAISRNLKNRLNLSTTSVLNMPRICVASPPERSNQSSRLNTRGAASPSTAKMGSTVLFRTTRSTSTRIAASAAMLSSGANRYRS